MSNTVRQILEDQLIAEWGATTPITWDDFNRNPAVGINFIRCTLDGIGASPLSLKCQREDYLLTIQVFTKAGEGPKTNMLLADELKRIYLGFSSGHLIVKSVIDERVGVSKEFYQRNVLIDLQYDNHII